MATTVVSELINEIGFSVDRTQMRQVERSFDRLRDRANQIGRSMTLAISAPLAALGAVSLKVASDAVETQNKFNQVFGDIANDANSFVSQLSTDLRRSETSIQDNLAALQSFGVGMGFAQGEAFKLSTNIQKLIFDFASFNNISDQEAFERFIAGLSGSGEVFDRFGINIKDAALGLELQSLGLAESTAKATEMQKVLGRVSIIQKALGRQGAIGDASRTMFEFASALKSTRAVLADLIGDFGKELLPVAKNILNTFNTFAISIRNKLTPEMKRVIVVFAGIAAIIGPLLLLFGGLITAVGVISSAFTALGTAAAAAGTTTGVLVAKFVLIGAAIAAIIAVVGLIVEDFLVFQRGGDSLIGSLIDKFKEFNSFLEDESIFFVGIFTSMFSDVTNAFKGFIGFFTNIFQGEWEKAVDSLVQYFTSAFVVALKLVTTPLQAVLDIFNQITGKDINVSSKVENISRFIGDESRKFALAPTLAEQGFNPVAIARNSENRFFESRENNVNVNSSITMNFPVGTDQSMVNSAEQQIKMAVRDQFATEIRKVAVDNPRVQR